ncbi:sarcosine oxidase subunit gamma [Actinomycetospora endophytica]|uniref:Sarcosine oxidase subunit gamma n=1 Tax=Actinomycetospora endophytica TaxID=2291215 RepID=A0ABS8P9B1_9PSEU|nr:sarcosine oxidase subunit gamma family protein [Actinomycetospora endophytica]MCD2194689.1 sarcosine oxidase subunit gamma [Actinomycetospora endophytica]
MADTLTRTHPLEAWRTAFAALSEELDPGLAIELAPLTTALDLRVDATGVFPFADVLGGPLPTAPNTWTPIRDGRAVWLGPDEWLVTSTTASGPRWEDEVRAVAGPHRGAVVDVSAQRTGVRLRGRDARELLSFGCALDLRPASFPAGSCAQTLLGQSGVLLLADDDGGPALDVVVRASFAGYVAGWLLDAAEELRPLPHNSDQEGDET